MDDNLIPDIYQAVEQNDLAEVHHLLEIDATWKPEPGQEPLLHLAANRGYGDMVALLLEYGFNINVATEYQTALKIAALNGDTAMICLLLTCEADPDLKQPLYYVLYRNYAEAALALVEGARMSTPASTSSTRPTRWRGDRRLQLKIGIHSGPAISVTLNDQLDYFGATVNIAARVSDLARGQEIVLTQAAYDEPGVEDIAIAYPRDCFASDIRGLDEKISVCRIALNPTPARPQRAPWR